MGALKGEFEIHEVNHNDNNDFGFVLIIRYLGRHTYIITVVKKYRRKRGQLTICETGQLTYRSQLRYTEDVYICCI